MSENNCLMICILLAVCAVSAAAVKGCAIVYDPASIKADAEARITLHQEFKK